jgi:mycothiol synthase
VPPPELVVPSVADAARIAAVANARATALHGTTEESAEDVARWFELPSLDPGADMRLALGANGAPEGYADVAGPADGTPRAWVDLRTPPESAAAREALFAWAEGRAAERAGTRGSIWFFVDDRDAGLRDLLRRSGYEIVRSSYEMRRSLDGPLQPAAWPAGLEVRPFRAEHAELVHAAQEEAFADHWGFVPTSFEEWRALNLGEGEDTSLWRIAWDGADVAGVEINRPRRGEDETVGWVVVLAVRRPWRRRGLGEALLREAFAAFAARGKTSAGLGVDAENTTGAVSLYERVGMHVVRRGDTWERRL